MFHFFRQTCECQFDLDSILGFSISGNVPYFKNGLLYPVPMILSNKKIEIDKITGETFINKSYNAPRAKFCSISKSLN